MPDAGAVFGLVCRPALGITPVSGRRALETRLRPPAGHDGTQRGALGTRREALLRGSAVRPPAAGPDRRRQHARRTTRPRAPGSLQGDDDEDGGLLELEHVIGFTGAHLSTLIALPRLSNAFVKSMGSVVVVRRRRRPALAGVPARARHGHLRARGLGVGRAGRERPARLGAPQGHHAPVIVWDGNTKRQAFVLHGHTLRVRSLCVLARRGASRAARAARAARARAPRRAVPIARARRLDARLTRAWGRRARARSRAPSRSPRSASCARRATTR